MVLCDRKVNTVKRKFNHCMDCDYILLPSDKTYYNMCNTCGDSQMKLMREGYGIDAK